MLHLAFYTRIETPCGGYLCLGEKTRVAYSGGMPPAIVMGHGKAIVRGRADEPRGEIPERKRGRVGTRKGVNKENPRSEVKAGL